MTTISAQSRSGYKIPCFDDGFDGDPIFVLQESLGVLAVIRARSWNSAFEVAQDLCFSDADPEDEDTYARSYDENADPEDLAEGVGYRPNGVPTDPDKWPEDNPFKLRSHMYREDLNGSRLTRVDPEDHEFDIVITIEEEV